MLGNLSQLVPKFLLFSLFLSQEFQDQIDQKYWIDYCFAPVSKLPQNSKMAS